MPQAANAVNKLPSNRLVKWQGKSSDLLLPEGLDPNEDEQLKKFGPWKLATEQVR